MQSLWFDLNRISSCLFYSEHEELVTHRSLNRTISNCMQENVIRSLLILSFRPKRQNCFNLLQSIYFPALELFLFLFLGFCSVGPLLCLFKVKRSELDTALTWVWPCRPLVNRLLPRLCLSYLPSAQTVSYYGHQLFREKRGGGDRKDLSYTRNDYTREKNKCLWWPHPVWLLGLEKCLYVFVLGTVYCCIDPALENRICTLGLSGKWIIKCSMCALKSKHTGRTFPAKCF